MKQCLFFMIGLQAVAIGCTQSGDNRRNRMQHLNFRDTLVYNTFRDTCLVFFHPNGDTIRFHRRFEIMENTFTDTMNVTFNWIPPGALGKRFSSQVDTFRDGILDHSDEYQNFLEENDLPVLYNHILCIYHLSGKVKTPAEAKQKASEYMRIRIWYKAKDKK